ncbi:MAG: hypothetical protein RLZZ163_102, partial [Actinomycetota bacterium]
MQRHERCWGCVGDDADVNDRCAQSGSGYAQDTTNDDGSTTTLS